MDNITMLGQVDSNFAAFTLVPAMVAIVLAFATKSVYLSLGSGIYSGFIILNIFNWYFLDKFIYQIGGFLKLLLIFIAPILQIPIMFTKVLGDPWNGGIVLQVLFIGGIIKLLTYTGGARILAQKISSHARTKKSSLLTTWLLGLIVFFDDYANALIVGPIMRPINDKMKVSREKFAFIIDATAAPIAGIAIISTWIGYELGLIQDALSQVGVEVSSFSVFIASIPFRFYNILMLIFILVLIFTKRDFGPMYKAEKLASEGEKTAGIKNLQAVEEDVEENSANSNLFDGIVPIVTLIISAFSLFYLSGYNSIISLNDDLAMQVMSSPFSFTSIRECFSNSDASVVLFQAAILTLTVMFIRGKIKKQFTFEKGSSVVIKGASDLLSTVFILLFAWSLGSIIELLGASEFLTSAVPESFPAYLVPAFGFALSGLIAFSTGTSYGTMGILMPIIIPLAYTINPEIDYVIVAISSVLTGATFGDHCSPISDTTILSSSGAGCNHIEHVKTQLPYAIFIGIIATLLYIPAAIFKTSISALVLIAIGTIIIYTTTMIIGKKV